MAVAVCLMGPTASGKTSLAVALSRRFPVDIISVDSALVYRGMDIGTAKPEPEVLQEAPHQLINIREPEESYSAGEFVEDATAAIRASLERGRLPLLVGGTMLYFRALTEGIAELPRAEPALRAQIDADAERLGWPAMHARLADVDPAAAARIEPNDRQRIQRALEVHAATGRSISDWQSAGSGERGSPPWSYLKLGLTVEPRARLHERIAVRLNMMFDKGLEEEVRKLMTRPKLTAEHASMRSVGYRQVWEWLSGATDEQTARDRALFATRQLAKRQITWMRSYPGLVCFDALDPITPEQIATKIATVTRR